MLTVQVGGIASSYSMLAVVLPVACMIISDVGQG